MGELPLRVVTHRNWLARRFTPHGGVQDFGMDICAEEALTYAWWAPSEWVARAHASGVPLPLVSCGANWVDRLEVPDHWLKRRVIAVSAGEAVEAASWLKGDTVFVKLPEAKTDSFPACLVFKNHLGTVLASPLISADTLVQLSEEVQFACEARFFVAHGRVVASSWYQCEGRMWAEEGFVGGTAYDLAVLAELANSVASNRKAPSGYTVDIGLIRGKPYTPAIVEFNAAWSSNPYDADMRGVCEAVHASNAHTLPDIEQRYQRNNWAFDVNGVPGIHRPLPARGSYR